MGYLTDFKNQIAEQLKIKTPLIWIYTKEEFIADKTLVQLVYKEGVAKHFYYSSIAGGEKIDPLTMEPASAMNVNSLTTMFSDNAVNGSEDKYEYPESVANTNGALNVLIHCDEPTCLVIRNDSDVFNNEQTQRFIVSECYRDNHAKGLYHPIFMISDRNTVPTTLEGFTKVIELPLMKAQDNFKVIYSWINKKGIQQEQSEIIHAAQSATGLTTTQLNRCLKESLLKEQKVNHKYINDVRIDLIKQSGVLTYIEPKMALDSVGGHDKLKEWIKESKLCMTPEAKKAGVEAPKGFLALGQAGTGKSAIAEAVANYLQVPFIIFDLSKMMGGLVGQSERAARHAFEILDSIGECVILMDEVDKQLGGVAGGTAANDGGTLMRVFGVILQHMQDNKSGQFYIMTANDVEKLPAPLMRAGRLDTKWFFDFPSEHEREEIFKIYLKDSVDHDIISYCAKQTDHFTGAEIKTAVNNMKRRAFIDKTKITKNVIIDALDSISTIYTTNREEVDSLSEYAEKHKIPHTSSKDKGSHYIETKANDRAIQERVNAVEDSFNSFMESEV